MADINLIGINKETFGTKMPNVFVNRITLDYTSSDPEDPSPDTEITANLSIKFTKPEHFQAGSAREFVKQYLDDVYLYVFLTYKSWIKRHLEENRFSIEYWHKTGLLEHHPYYASGRFRRIPLSSIIADENPYSSKLVILPTFDEDGNEIIEITNINITMPYRYGGSFGIPAIQDVNDLMLLAYTGIKAAGRYSGSGTPGDDGLFSERYDDAGYSTNSSTPWNNLASNTYFSDVTYYHILQQNRIATKFFQAYTTSPGVPYFGSVLQSTNGNFYATDNYSFDNVRATLEALIDEHMENRSADGNLDSNIKNLEAIINATDNKSGVLLQLSDYRATYPNKSPTALSGAFYSEFVIAFADIIQAVQAQEQLVVAQLYDSLVVDYRQNLLAGTYRAPDPSGKFPTASSHRLNIASADTKKGYVYETPSDCYIPKKWFLLARKAWLTNLITSYTADELETLYRARSIVDTGAGDLRSLESDAEGSEYSRLLAELNARYTAAGFSAAEASRMANRELAYYYATHEDFTGDPGSVRSELLNPTLNGGEYLELRAGDTVVKNQGRFIFDYEKALRTQSMIAHVLDITKLQQLFRINVPYEHFYVKKVELSRNELRLDATSIDSEHDKYIRTKMQLNMKTPTLILPDFPAPIGEYIDYPKNKNIDYKYSGGKDEGEETDELAILSHKLKYLRPHYKVGDKDYVSSLTFVNFDLPDSDETSTLKGYNNLDAALDGSMGDLATARVLDGYRLMAFKFEDAMDDDVAYYNTQDTDDEERLELLRASNNLNEPRTCYSVTIQVEDQTQLTYDNFVEYVSGVYNEFVEYYEYAVEACSHNNILNEFNQFFIDQINELYPGKIWTRAVYVAHALSELMFKTGTAFNESLFQENVLEHILKIAPETGNLAQLTAFATSFKQLLAYLRIDEIATISAGISTPVQRMKDMFSYHPSGTGFARTIEFYNEKPIWEPIAGDITPDDIPLSSLTEVGSYTASPKFAVQVHTAAAVGTPASTPVGETSGELTLGELFNDSYYLIRSSDDIESFRDEYGDTAVDSVAIAAKVLELVFYPRNRFEVIEVLDSYRPNPLLTFYNMKGFVDHIASVAHVPPAAGEHPFEPTQEALSVDSGMATRYVGEVAAAFMESPSGASYSWAYWFLDNIMAYSTMDVNVTYQSPTDIGRLKPGVARDAPTTRRDNRNMVTCLALLDRLERVSAHVYSLRTTSTDGSSTIFEDGFYSKHYADINTLVQEIEDMTPLTTTGFKASDLGPVYSDSAEAILAERERELVIDEDAVRDNINNVYSNIYLRAHATISKLKDVLQIMIRSGEDHPVFISYMRAYGLEGLFNEDDPIGPTTGYFGDSGSPDADNVSLSIYNLINYY